MNSKLFISIGISGSGKTTYYKNRFLIDFPEVNDFLKSNELTIDSIRVCPDDIRREVCGDVNIHTNEPYVWRLVEKRLKENLSKYNYALFDAINIVYKTRKFLSGIKNVHKIALVFEPNIELSKERIKKDISECVDRSNVPMNVIDRQFESFKKSVVGDLNWNAIYNEVAKEKIKIHLSKEFNEIIFI